jgi:acetyl esterase
VNEGDLESRRQAGGLVLKRVAWMLGLGLCLLSCVVTLAFAAGSLLEPASSIYAMWSSFAWPLLGPHLTVLTLVCMLVAVVAARRGPRILGWTSLCVAAIALLSSAVITGRILAATSAAGGSANPFSGLLLHTLNAKPDSTVTFEEVDGQKLSAVVYKPSDSDAPAPVIMYIHGGGWIQGSAANLGHDMRWFADRGYLVVSVDYRLATPSQSTWDKAPQDVACALTWIHQNAPRYGGDPQRIVVAGDSAGGNLAVNLSYGAALGRARSGCGGQVPIPEAVLVQYPIVAPQDAYDNGYPIRGFEPKMFTDRYLGGVPSEVPDRLAAISSITYLSAKAPPTLIVEPDNDGLIPSRGVLAFAEKAQAAGVDVTVHRIPHSNHIYDELFAGSIGNQAGLTIRQAYLAKLGLAP